MYGVLAVAAGDSKAPKENFPFDDEESNDYSGLPDFFGSKNQYNSHFPSQSSDENFIPDIEIFLPDVSNEKDDAPKSNDDLGESDTRSKSYDYWPPLNLKAAPSQADETLNLTDIDESHINSVLSDFGISLGSKNDYYGDDDYYEDETTTAEPDVVTTTFKSEEKTETTSALPREPKVYIAPGTSTTTGDLIPENTTPVSLPQEEQTPPPIEPNKITSKPSTINSITSTTSSTTTLQTTETNRVASTTSPTTTSTSTTLASSTSTPTAIPQTSSASTTTATTEPTTTTSTTTRRTTEASATTTTVSHETPTQPAVKSTKSAVPNVVSLRVEVVEVHTEEEKFTGHSRASTHEEMAPKEGSTTSSSEVSPKKVEFSTVVLIISLISVVIVLVFVLMVVIFVRARLHRQGKYDIPPDSDMKSGVAESSSKTKFVNEMDSSAVVVPVQYNNSVA